MHVLNVVLKITFPTNTVFSRMEQSLYAFFIFIFFTVKGTIKRKGNITSLFPYYFP